MEEEWVRYPPGCEATTARIEISSSPGGILTSTDEYSFNQDTNILCASIFPNYNQLNEWPLQFLRTGNYLHSFGYPYSRTTNSHVWSDTASSAYHGRYLGSWTGSVNAQNSYPRGDGHALRCVAAKANQLANFPLNFLRTGYYYYSDGKIYARATHGDWWSATRSSATNANRLYTNIASINSQFSDARGIGFALRCVAHQRALFEKARVTLSAAQSKTKTSKIIALSIGMTEPRI